VTSAAQDAATMSGTLRGAPTMFVAGCSRLVVLTASGKN
jgi:hypothetical protein